MSKSMEDKNEAKDAARRATRAGLVTVVYYSNISNLFHLVEAGSVEDQLRQALPEFYTIVPVFSDRP